MDKIFEANRITPELLCTDIKKSLDFYLNILGFQVYYQREEDGFVMLTKEGIFLMIEEFDPDHEDSYWITGKLEKPLGRGINFEIRVENVDALYNNVLLKNIEVFLPLEDKWYRANDCYLGNRQFMVQDPDGYLFRFYQSLGRRNI